MATKLELLEIKRLYVYSVILESAGESADHTYHFNQGTASAYAIVLDVLRCRTAYDLRLAAHEFAAANDCRHCRPGCHDCQSAARIIAQSDGQRWEE